MVDCVTCGSKTADMYRAGGRVEIALELRPRGFRRGLGRSQVYEADQAGGCDLEGAFTDGAILWSRGGVSGEIEPRSFGARLWRKAGATKAKPFATDACRLTQMKFQATKATLTTKGLGARAERVDDASHMTPLRVGDLFRRRLVALDWFSSSERSQDWLRYSPTFD